MAQGRIADRVAIITGGGSGIGRATAELFAQEGAKVVIGDLSSSEGEQVAKSIGGLFVATDVREAKAVQKLVSTACDQFGGLDIMFNNAGIGIVAPLLETSEELYSNTLRVDLDGVYWGPEVRRQGDGRAKARRHRKYRIGGRRSRGPWIVGI